MINWEIFVSTLTATSTGVILSVILTVLVYNIRESGSNNRHRRWIKERLIAEWTQNFRKLRILQTVIAGAKEKGLLPVNFYSCYMTLEIYETTITGTYMKLFPRDIQVKIYDTASKMKEFNYLLGSTEALSNIVLTNSGLMGQYRSSIGILNRQAQDFEADIIKLLKSLGVKEIKVKTGIEQPPPPPPVHTPPPAEYVATGETAPESSWEAETVIDLKTDNGIEAGDD